LAEMVREEGIVFPPCFGGFYEDLRMRQVKVV
jgi:hypothetical protein